MAYAQTDIIGEPKRGMGAYALFNHPHTVRRCKRRERKKDKRGLREFYDVNE